MLYDKYLLKGRLLPGYCEKEKRIVLMKELYRSLSHQVDIRISMFVPAGNDNDLYHEKLFLVDFYGIHSR